MPGYISLTIPFLLLHLLRNPRPVPFLEPTYYKVPYNSDNPYFYCLPPQNISDKFSTITDICRFLQPGLIPSATFGEKTKSP